jgi:pyruvate,water dikinase
LQEIERICKAHRLSENPLWFFERLIFWRETRKKYTLMGVHALHEVLSGIERLTGIPYKHLQFMTFDEVPYVLRGQLTADELHSRREKGILLDFEKGSYRIHYGEEAISLRKEFEEELASQNTAQVIYGQVASQGYARCIARVILDQSQFDRFNEGEILVTGMTRPEFVPLMKKAAAIVTNEGGVTCHAAIVSRELGKPCIIGTKNATSLIPDGATIEVRANHGTVRVL